MSVAPDLLLKPAPEMKPKASAPKAPDTSAEPRKNEASSFAQVYAKERQAKAAERNDAAAKSNRESKPDAAQAETKPPGDAAGQPVVADSGKPLPTDSTEEPEVTDPLLLFGLAGQPAVDVEGGDAVLEGDGEQLVMPSGSLVSSGPASMTDASFDPELDALNQMPAVQMALELGAKAKAAAAEQGAGTAAGQATLSTGQSFASAMAAMGAQQTQEGEVGDVIDLPALEVTEQGLEALKESAADTRPENFVSKLHALSQAISQQSATLPRAGVVGQPVAMNQAGWSEAVVDRVMMLSSQNLKSAEIQLDPAELGRLEVRISMSQDQTQVTFASANAGVRDALEGQMHRLREMFTQQGMNLTDVNVSDQSPNRGWQGQGQDGDSGHRGRGGGSGDLFGSHEDDVLAATVDARSSASSGGRGMVDYYA